MEMILLWSIKMGQMMSLLILFSMISTILLIRMYKGGQEWGNRPQEAQRLEQIKK